MKIIKEGDSGKGICDSCGLVNTTYLLRDLDFSDNRGTVRNVLAGVCNKCNKVINVPSQSIPQIKSEYNKQSKSFETRVPAHFIDILNLAVKKIDIDLDENFIKHLIFYYLHGLNSGKFKAKKLSNFLDSDVAKAKASKRFSIKINEKAEKELDNVINISGLNKKSDVMKGIILQINEDIVQTKKPKYLDELKTIASAYH